MREEMKENDLTSLPNIGKVLSEKLGEVGIITASQLKAAGSENTFLRLLAMDEHACINELLALEGAIQGIRWHNLDNHRKVELRTFLRICKLQHPKASK